VLLMTGDEDGLRPEDARQLDVWAVDSELVIVGSGQHGTDILDEGGPPARTLEEAMADFVDRVAAGSATC
jgi:hypothetical protein